MKFLLLLLLISTAYATNITSGQIFMSETPNNGYLDLVLNASFQAPGYSFTNVYGADFFTITPHLPYFCGWQNGGCTLDQIANTGPLAYFVQNLGGFANGVEGISGLIEFSETSFVSSFTSDGYTIAGTASAYGGISVCRPVGIDCVDGPGFSFNPAQRWNYSAHFSSFYGQPDLYALNDMTITSTPEVNSFLLTLIGCLTGILIGWHRT